MSVLSSRMYVLLGSDPLKLFFLHASTLSSLSLARNVLPEHVVPIQDDGFPEAVPEVILMRTVLYPASESRWSHFSSMKS